jgi:hypothetical protein
MYEAAVCYGTLGAEMELLRLHVLTKPNEVIETTIVS